MLWVSITGTQKEKRTNEQNRWLCYTFFLSEWPLLKSHSSTPAIHIYRLLIFCSLFLIALCFSAIPPDLFWIKFIFEWRVFSWSSRSYFRQRQAISGNVYGFSSTLPRIKIKPDCAQNFLNFASAATTNASVNRYITINDTNIDIWTCNRDITMITLNDDRLLIFSFERFKRHWTRPTSQYLTSNTSRNT